MAFSEEPDLEGARLAFMHRCQPWDKRVATEGLHLAQGEIEAENAIPLRIGWDHTAAIGFASLVIFELPPQYIEDYGQEPKGDGQRPKVVDDDHRAGRFVNDKHCCPQLVRNEFHMSDAMNRDAFKASRRKKTPLEDSEVSFEGSAAP